MKANEIQIKDDYTSKNTSTALATYGERQHYKFTMSLGRCWPTTKSQAQHFIKTGMKLDVLYQGDVERIEELCKRHGLDGQIDYKVTKSGKFVRVSMESYGVLERAMRLEYGIGNSDECQGNGTCVC